MKCLRCQRVQLPPQAGERTWTIDRVKATYGKGGVLVTCDGEDVTDRCFEATTGERGFVLLFAVDVSNSRRTCETEDCARNRALRADAAVGRPRNEWGIQAEIRYGHVIVAPVITRGKAWLSPN